MCTPKRRGLPCAIPGWRATARMPPCRPVAASSQRCSLIHPLRRRHLHRRARHRPRRRRRRARRPSVPGRRRFPALRHPGRHPSPALRHHPDRAPRHRGSARPTSNRCGACRIAGPAGRGCSAWRSTWWCCWPARGGWRAGSSTASASRRGNGRLPRRLQRPRQPPRRRLHRLPHHRLPRHRLHQHRLQRRLRPRPSPPRRPRTASAWHGHPSRAPQRLWSMN